MPTESSTSASAAFLADGGALGAAMRAHDWSATPLGAPQGWPAPLRTLVGVMLGAGQAMFIAWGAERALLYNDSYAALLGGKHPQALGRPLLKVWREIEADIAPLVDRVFSGEAVNMRDMRLEVDRGAGLEEAFFAFSYTPVRDDEGRVQGLFCAVTEITAEVRGARELRESEARLRALTDNLPSGMVYQIATGPDGTDRRFLFVSQSHERLTGVSAEAVMANPLLPYHLILPEHRDRLAAAEADAIAAMRPFDAEAPFCRADTGEVRWSRIVSAPRPTPDGVIWDGLQIDITDRRQAEEELRESEARLQSVLESVSDGFYALGPDWKLTLFNAAAEAYFGVKREQVLGRDLWTLFRQGRGTPYETQMRALMEGGPAFRFEAESLLQPGRFMELRATGKVGGGIAVSFSDITERKVAELKRRESEAVLRAFFDTEGLYAAVLEEDRETVRYVMANRSLTALMGAEGAEGRSTEDLLGRPPTPETMALLRRVAALGRSVTFEHPAETAKGQRWFSATVSPLTPVDGRPRFAAASLDITERRRAEEALRDSEARFRAITEALPQIVWSTLPDGFHDYYNARWYEFTGVPEGSTDGEAWNDVFHPEDQPRARDLWRRSLATGEDYEIEYRLRHNSGAYRWVLGRARAVRDAAGDIVRWMGTCTDIQDIVEAREVLSRSREDLEGEVAARTADRDRMWRHSRDLLAVLGKDGVFRNVSPSWTAMLGYGTNELVGRSVFQFIVGDDAQPTASALTTASSQALTNFENRYAHKDGSVRWISWRTSVEAELIYAYGRDVTAEKAQAARLAQIEEQLRQSQKMEAVGQLTGGIAHDFNNLLQGITGSLDLIGKRVAQGRTGELERFISGAMTSANRAAALTHRLLAFSRRQPLDPRPVKANPLVASMEDLLRRTIGENIELELVLAGGLWLTLCDPNQLESAILNLVINARDAMPDGGKLTVETCNAHLDNAYAATARDVAPGQYVCVCVTDTGTGMTPEVVERAFDPFFTTKPIGQGTGLGLSMIYGFARQSEGYCKIYSEVGQGTTIKLYLPRHRGEAAEEESAPELSEAHAAEAGETVVVIEDEPVVRGLIVEVLHELGYRALEASDGAAGLALVQATPRVDLLITDIGLPGLNGRQVADAARAKRPELKVLFMTGYAENAAFANGFLEPGMSMITKPFAMEMLATRVRDIIEGR